MHNYDDIINLEYKKSKKYPHMDKIARAAQFAPFAALTGFDDEIYEESRLTDSEYFLNEAEIFEVNEMLSYLKEHEKDNIIIEVIFFKEDKRKKGGKNNIYQGMLKRINLTNKCIEFKDHSIINFKQIKKINIID